MAVFSMWLPVSCGRLYQVDALLFAMENIYLCGYAFFLFFDRGLFVFDKMLTSGDIGVIYDLNDAKKAVWVINRITEAADGRGISSRWFTASGKPEYTRQRT